MFNNKASSPPVMSGKVLKIKLGSVNCLGNFAYIKMNMGQFSKQEGVYSGGILENIQIDLCVYARMGFLFINFCPKTILQITKLSIRQFMLATNV